MPSVMHFRLEKQKTLFGISSHFITINNPVCCLMPSILLEQHGKKAVGDFGHHGKKALHFFIEQFFRIHQIVHGFSKGETRVNLEISTFAMLEKVIKLRRTGRPKSPTAFFKIDRVKG